MYTELEKEIRESSDYIFKDVLAHDGPVLICLVHTATGEARTAHITPLKLMFQSPSLKASMLYQLKVSKLIQHSNCFVKLEAHFYSSNFLALIFEEHFDGNPARGAHGEARESCVVERDDPLADAEPFHDFAKIARQRARPAQGVDAISERSRDQFMEIVHHLDAVVAGRQHQKKRSLQHVLTSWRICSVPKTCRGRANWPALPV